MHWCTTFGILRFFIWFCTHICRWFLHKWRNVEIPRDDNAQNNDDGWVRTTVWVDASRGLPQHTYLHAGIFPHCWLTVSLCSHTVALRLANAHKHTIKRRMRFYAPLTKARAHMPSTLINPYAIAMCADFTPSSWSHGDDMCVRFLIISLLCLCRDVFAVDFHAMLRKRASIALNPPHKWRYRMRARMHVRSNFAPIAKLCIFAISSCSEYMLLWTQHPMIMSTYETCRGRADVRSPSPTVRLHTTYIRCV